MSKRRVRVRLRLHVTDDLFGATVRPGARLKPPVWGHPILTAAQHDMWSAIAPRHIAHGVRNWVIERGTRAQVLALVLATFPEAEVISDEGPWSCITIIETKEITE